MEKMCLQQLTTVENCLQQLTTEKQSCCKPFSPLKPVENRSKIFENDPKNFQTIPKIPKQLTTAYNSVHF